MTGLNTSKTILITGASSGIGQALAERLAADGHEVLLVARSSEKLRVIVCGIKERGGHSHYMAADLADKNGLDALVGAIKQKYQKIDLLINNAGIGWYGHFAQMPWDTAQSLVLTNMLALVKLTHAFLPDMITRNEGQIINISSIAGDLPVQGVILYASSKAFVNNFTKALAREMTGTKIKITLVKPGPVLTNFYNHANESNGYHIPGESLGITVEQASRTIIKCIGSSRRVVYVPGYFAFMPWVDRLLGPVIDRLGPMIIPADKKGGVY
ncbi:MAG: oxidoreductase [Anaerolinea sp.]|nr:oxidoreductase [Anaerolinea sp.]